MDQQKIFFSYALNDASDFALRLYNDLQNAGADVWIDQRDIKAGARWDVEIEKALIASDCVLFVVSEEAVQSDNVLDQVSYAFGRRKPVIPVKIDNSQIPLLFSRLQYVDFSLNRYEIAFSNLLDLIRLLSNRGGWVSEKSKSVVEKKEEIKNSSESNVLAEPEELNQKRKVDIKTQKSKVYLGVATPPAVVIGREFIVRFGAYIAEFRKVVFSVFKKEAPTSNVLLDLHTCEWKIGAPVTVRLSASGFQIEEGLKKFKWNGKWEIIHFDVHVPLDYPHTEVILKFDIIVAGLPIITLRPELKVLKPLDINFIKHLGKLTEKQDSILEEPSPETAFASYSKPDRREVLGRLRSLQIYTNIDVFLDCLSLRPGKEWKKKLYVEIRQRDIFFLFWSHYAMKSVEVEWEWRTALAQKPLNKIQPHPLEPAELAPPPKELEKLQSGNAYELYLVALKPTWSQKVANFLKKPFS